MHDFRRRSNLADDSSRWLNKYRALCHHVRTAIGTFNGTLKATPATELGATWFARRYGARVSMFGIGPVPAVRQALERARWNLSDVERVAPWRQLALLAFPDRAAA